ncbi:(3,5-dihydroxyphenyl)acetyl-CoA 1,2-dioxygenase DpgC [Streptomyces sp. NPDC058457]|uniref:(3,5-dihydroxyphenyl)acetyl-CoA 1,2-dioxygenase DpgC n=1 Tax=Streptomyces sp. NPDC058457 TaxID=3346507 RepID=UPI0036538515
MSAIATAPGLVGDLEQDRAALAAHTAETERLLAAYPSRPLRTPQQQEAAERLFGSAREVRQAFLALHTDTVYDELTERHTRHLRLPELLLAAAERFPGLVPTSEQMAAENAWIQAEKDGREVDQAIFCSAVLRSPTAGRHLVEAMLQPTRHALELLPGYRAEGRIELDRVLVERHGRATHITFRNAHCLNAEDNRLIADLETAVDLALLDEATAVGVLRGGEVDHPRYQGRRVFSAGINLKDLRNGDISFVEFLLGRELGYINKMYRGLVTAPGTVGRTERPVQKPWVGAVDTFAIGGGMQLLLVLDRVIAEEGAWFSLPAAEEGIVPGLGNLRLSRLTGARTARQVILGGRRISTDDPDFRHLCDEVVSADGMAGAVERAVTELAAPAVAANRHMLCLVEEPLDLYREYLAEFAVVQAARSYSEDVLDKVERRWQKSQGRG